MANDEEDRRRAIERFLRGQTPAAVYGSLGYSHRWFYKWLARYRAGGAEWFREQSRSPHHLQRTPREIEQIVAVVRLNLYNRALFCGAQAIRWELDELGVRPLPSVRTINRILVRNALTHRRTGRHQPKGKKYPGLASVQPSDVHQSDFVGPCYLTGAGRFYSLHTVEVATRRCAVEPLVHRHGQHVVDALWASWQRLGIPHHQQVDNEMVFYGSPAHPPGMGMLIRLCLLHEVEPWFIPPGEPWRNGVVEKFNDHWRQKLLGRIVMHSVADLQKESRAFELRHNSFYRYSPLGGKTAPRSAHQHGDRLAVSADPGRAAPPVAQTNLRPVPLGPLHPQRWGAGPVRREVPRSPRGDLRVRASDGGCRARAPGVVSRRSVDSPRNPTLCAEVLRWG